MLLCRVLHRVGFLNPTYPPLFKVPMKNTIDAKFNVGLSHTPNQAWVVALIVTITTDGCLEFENPTRGKTPGYDTLTRRINSNEHMDSSWMTARGEAQVGSDRQPRGWHLQTGDNWGNTKRPAIKHYIFGPERWLQAILQRVNQCGRDRST